MARHKRHDETPDDADRVETRDAPDRHDANADAGAADGPVPREGEAPRASDGMPEAEGNRDDAAERDMGLRDERVMGTPPAAKGGGGAETTDAKVKRLEKELAQARAAIDSLVPAAAQQALGVDPKARAKAAKGTGGTAPAAAEEKLPGEGPVVWLGSIAGGGPIPSVRFRGGENEAEAREAYLKHAGIKSTTGKVTVTRADAGGAAVAAAALASAAETAKAARRKGK